jgi:chitodextrinase
MKSKLLLLIVLTLSVFSYSQTEKSLWKPAVRTEQSIIVENKVGILNPKLVQLDIEKLKKELVNTPNRYSNESISRTILSFPDSNGQLERYSIAEFSNMDPELAAKYPEIKSYVGQGIENPTSIIYFSLSPLGFQSMVVKADQSAVFIEPYTTDLNSYVVYKKSDKAVSQNTFECTVVDKVKSTISSNIFARPNADDGNLRNYRLALSVTAEYTTYFGGTKALALAAMNNSMTRVNGVFEKDFGVHMNLIANNDLLIYLDAATDPYSPAANKSQWNAQLQATLTSVITEANYDIGHLFGATGGGGNAGCIGCVCVNGSKGSGITSPADGIPQGDNFDIDYVAHEMGHQFGGNHTFTHSNEGTGVQMEPGSGSTIMAYAGITSLDVQPHSDAYFHAISIQQITNYIKTTTCQTTIVTGNSIPTALAGLDYTIPKSTPFMLTGSGTDANGDSLTYDWEQMDSQNTAAVPSATKTSGVNFRSYNPTASPIRFFPKMSSVLTGATTTAGTELVVEALPSVARTLNFRLTVRDYHIGGPANNSDDMIVTVNATAGPFTVNSPNTVVSYIGNTSQTITWAVAGTTANGVNCANVDILLSTDGGNTFPITLLASTPNDGTQALIIPNVVGTTNRIMIKGTNHIFFDVSNTNFIITAGTLDTIAPTAPTLSASGTTQTTTNLSWIGATDNIAVTSYNIYQNGILIGNTPSSPFTVTGLTAGTTYTFTVKAKDADGNLSVLSNAVNVTTTAPDTTAPTAPVLTFSGTTSTSTLLSWSGATDNIAVTGYDIFQAGINIGSTTVATTFAVTGLTPSTTYFFTVKAKDAAGNLSANSNTVTITTQAPDTTPPSAPILSASGTTSTTTNLTWTGATDNIAVTGYDVYRGITLIGSVGTTSFSVTGLTALTTYSFTVKAKDAAGNISVASNTVTITTAQFTYCTSLGSSVVDELIGNVQLGTINNTSTGGTGYTDFTSISTNLVIGSSNTITITPTWTGTVYPEGYAVFIDYNHNGLFTDAGETVWTKAASTTTPAIGSFTIPATALLGSTRMRVSLKYNGIPTSCETFSFGQVEDYTVVLVTSSATTINLKLFIEGYYDTATNEMRAVKANQGIGSSTTYVDDVTIELRNASTYAVVATTNAMLQTNGNAIATFTSGLSGSYYVVVKHRNAVQTWSTNPVVITSSTSYDFTNAVNKALGSNMIELETGIFGLYSGDINQDEVIDGSDSTELFNDIDNTNFGYLSTDINGDGAVDNSDTTSYLNNTENSVFSIHP